MSTTPLAPTGGLTLEATRRALDAGIEMARSLGISVSLAVVDAGGILKAFARMDGAEIAGEVLAVDKAFTAVSHRAPTAELVPLAKLGGDLFGLQVAGRGRYVIFGGGLPLVVDGLVIGAVGVSGGSASEDVSCAERMVTALLGTPETPGGTSHPGSERL